MTPMELARIKEFTAKIRGIAEDFHKVFYNRLMVEMPELRIHYLTSICEDGAELCAAIERIAEAADDPVALEQAIAVSRTLANDNAHRLQALNFRTFFWTADRCFGAEFTAADRAVFESLHRVVAHALDRLYGPSVPGRSGSGLTKDRAPPAALASPAGR